MKLVNVSPTALSIKIKAEAGRWSAPKSKKMRAIVLTTALIESIAIVGVCIECYFELESYVLKISMVYFNIF
jgi:hypothetical protein